MSTGSGAPAAESAPTLSEAKGQDLAGTASQPCRRSCLAIVLASRSEVLRRLRGKHLDQMRRKAFRRARCGHPVLKSPLRTTTTPDRVKHRFGVNQHRGQPILLGELEGLL